MKYNGTTYYYVYNYQGDVIKLLDSNMNVAAQYTYDAWGNPVSILDGSGNDVSQCPWEIANVNPFRYRGYYWDQETQLYYLNSRYYNPQWGRFLNADGLVDGEDSLLATNIYIYCNNNPVMHSDPSGLKPGDYFQSIDAAAKDFGKYINAYSIKYNRECGATI